MRTVPHYQTRFVGRRQEADRLVAGLRPGSLLTVVGTGGVGKTRLVADTLRTRRLEALFVDLTTARATEDMHVALLRDLGAGPGSPGEHLADRSAAELRAARPPIAVLDNLEHLPEDSAEVVSAWQRAAPDTAFVCTSRALPTRGDTLALEPFEVDADAADAVQLFVRALPLLGAAPVDPTRDRDRIRNLVRRLDGLPLAIELAAARTAVLPLDEIERRLDAPLALLKDAARLEDRTSTLTRSVAWSWETLPLATASALAQASVFAGPFDWDAAQAVLSVEGDLADHLQVLVTRHLMRMQDARFVPYEAVRAFAADRLTDPAPVRARHALWTNRVARRCWLGELGWDRLLALSPEVDQVMARAVAPDATAPERRSGRILESNAIALYLARWPLTRHLELARTLTEPVAGEDLADPSFLVAWGSRGARALSLRLLDECEQSFRKVLELSRLVGHGRGTAIAYNQLAGVACLRGDHAASAPLVAEALAAARTLSDPALLVELLCGVGNFHAVYEGRFEEVETRLAEALELARSVNPGAVETALRRRHALACLRGDWAAADRWLAEVRAVHAAMPELARFRAYEVGFHETLSRLCVEGSAAADAARAWAASDVAREGLTEPRLLDLWAASLAGHADAAERIAAFAARVEEGVDPRQATISDAVTGAASALLGHPRPRVGPAPTDGAAAAVVRISRLFDEVAEGRCTASVALERAQAESPVSFWAFALRRGLSERADAERREAATWQVAEDGGWFRAPGGDPVELAGRPTLARIAVALARQPGEGLDADGMFAAGWPGERATASARANRVRVAVTTLRRMGLECLAWTRGRGWFLEGPVRLVSADQALRALSST